MMIRIFHVLGLYLMIISSLLLLSTNSYGWESEYEGPIWPMELGNCQNDGGCEGSYGDETPQFLWSLDLEGRTTSPLIDAEGNLIIATSDQHLYCLFPNGTIKWSTGIGFYPANTPAILSDGTIIMTQYSDAVHAYTKDGVHLWEHYSAVDHQSPPAVGPDDNTFIVCEDMVLSITPDGEYRWNQVVDGDVYSPPCVGENGEIYIHSQGDYHPAGSGRTFIYSFDPSGLKQWRQGISGFGAPMILEDGRIFAAGNRKIACLNSDGTNNWTVEIEKGRVGSSAATDDDGNIYFVMGDTGYRASDGHLYSFYPNGTMRWIVEDVGHGAYPLVDGDGRIILCNDRGLCAFSTDGDKLWRLPMFGEYSGVVIHPNGNIYITTWNSNQLFCVGQGEDIVPHRPLNVKGDVNDNGGVSLTCELPTFETYPFISSVNVYQKKGGEYERIETFGKIRDPWEWSQGELEFNDEYIDVSVKQYFYFTFENRLGESEPSEVIVVFDESVIWGRICVGSVLGSTVIIMIGAVVTMIIVYRRKKLNPRT
ncbi:MAG: PQQ-like beta-propeller repeat protein [Thermoplasmata archaeon]|nr:PQQ-like beta-propeller repeat protein [Thermoplasmata archaeon]